MRITKELCWERLEQLDLKLRGCSPVQFEGLMENRRFFEEQLKRLLKKEKTRMANSEKQVNETVGNSQGQNKGQEQCDLAQKALRYQDRFAQDRAPNGHNMGDTDKVKG